MSIASCVRYVALLCVAHRTLTPTESELCTLFLKLDWTLLEYAWASVARMRCFKCFSVRVYIAIGGAAAGGLGGGSEEASCKSSDAARIFAHGRDGAARASIEMLEAIGSRGGKTCASVAFMLQGHLPIETDQVPVDDFVGEEKVGKVFFFGKAEKLLFTRLSILFLFRFIKLSSYYYLQLSKSTSKDKADINYFHTCLKEKENSIG